MFQFYSLAKIVFKFANYYNKKVKKIGGIFTYPSMRKT
jgi:hypothetical protein